MTLTRTRREATTMSQYEAYSAYALGFVEYYRWAAPRGGLPRRAAPLGGPGGGGRCCGAACGPAGGFTPSEALALLQSKLVKPLSSRLSP
jgi:hypothetical protein